MLAKTKRRKKGTRYPLIEPPWMLLTVVIIGMVEMVAALGPIFSNHVWSTVRLAIFRLKIKVNLGKSR